MVGKSTVSALQEYCARNKHGVPVYDYVDSEDGGFDCRIEVIDVIAHGKGRSKRDAKHQAAANAIADLRTKYSDIDDIQLGVNEEMPSTDVVAALRDYCVQYDHPLPMLDIIQQTGTPDAPEFTGICVIASIRRYGIADNKKDARQKAALEMLKVIQHKETGLEKNLQLVTPLDTKTQDVEFERYKKFKTYRELSESGTSNLPGVRLCDRHHYFEKFYAPLKTEAYKVLSTEYETYKQQATELLFALKITPKISRMPSMTTEPLIFIELNCSLDVVFCNVDGDVYKDIINYFRDML